MAAKTDTKDEKSKRKSSKKRIRTTTTKSKKLTKKQVASAKKKQASAKKKQAASKEKVASKKRSASKKPEKKTDTKYKSTKTRQSTRKKPQTSKKLDEAYERKLRDYDKKADWVDDILKKEKAKQRSRKKAHQKVAPQTKSKYREEKSRKKEMQKRQEKELSNSVAGRARTSTRKYREKREAMEVEDEQERAASKIQKVWRQKSETRNSNIQHRRMTEESYLAPRIEKTSKDPYGYRKKQQKEQRRRKSEISHRPYSSRGTTWGTTRAVERTYGSSHYDPEIEKQKAQIRRDLEEVEQLKRAAKHKVQRLDTELADLQKEKQREKSRTNAKIDELQRLQDPMRPNKRPQSCNDPSHDCRKEFNAITKLNSFFRGIDKAHSTADEIKQALILLNKTFESDKRSGRFNKEGQRALASINKIFSHHEQYQDLERNQAREDLGVLNKFLLKHFQDAGDTNSLNEMSKLVEKRKPVRARETHRYTYRRTTEKTLEETYRHMSVEDLRVLAKNYGLGDYGSKDAIVERLMRQHHRQMTTRETSSRRRTSQATKIMTTEWKIPSPTQPTRPSPTSKDANEMAEVFEALLSVDEAEIREALRVRGLKANGTKTELICRLIPALKAEKEADEAARKIQGLHKIRQAKRDVSNLRKDKWRREYTSNSGRFEVYMTEDPNLQDNGEQQYIVRVMDQ